MPQYWINDYHFIDDFSNSGYKTKSYAPEYHSNRQTIVLFDFAQKSR